MKTCHPWTHTWLLQYLFSSRKRRVVVNLILIAYSILWIFFCEKWSLDIKIHVENWDVTVNRRKAHGNPNWWFGKDLKCFLWCQILPPSITETKSREESIRWMRKSCGKIWRSWVIMASKAKHMKLITKIYSLFLFHMHAECWIKELACQKGYNLTHSLLWSCNWLAHLIWSIYCRGHMCWNRSQIPPSWRQSVLVCSVTGSSNI